MFGLNGSLRSSGTIRKPHSATCPVGTVNLQSARSYSGLGAGLGVGVAGSMRCGVQVGGGSGVGGGAGVAVGPAGWRGGGMAWGAGEPAGGGAAAAAGAAVGSAVAVGDGASLLSEQAARSSVRTAATTSGLTINDVSAKRGPISPKLLCHLNNALQSVESNLNDTYGVKLCQRVSRCLPAVLCPQWTMNVGDLAPGANLKTAGPTAVSGPTPWETLAQRAHVVRRRVAAASYDLRPKAHPFHGVLEVVLG